MNVESCQAAGRGPTVEPTASAVRRHLGRRRGGELDRPQHPRGRPGGDRAGRDVGRHDAVGADHAAVADRHAARDDDVRAAPHVVADPRRPLRREPLPRDRPARVVEAVVAVGDEAAVGEHAVAADLDERGRGDHHADVEERPLADPHARRRGRRDPDVGLEQRARADLQAPVAQRLEHVAVDRPARERLAIGELPVDPRAVPGQRVALVPAPLLPPEPRPPRVHGTGSSQRAGTVRTPSSPPLETKKGAVAGAPRSKPVSGRLPLVAVDHGLAVAHLRVLAPDEDGVEAGAAVDRDLGAHDGEDRVVAGAAEDLVAALAPQPGVVFARAAEDRVRALAALEVVVALVAEDAVRAAAAVDGVVAEAALEDVAGAEAAVVVVLVAPDDVVAAVAEDVVGAVAAGDVVVAVRAGAGRPAVRLHPRRALGRVLVRIGLDDALAARDAALAQSLRVRDAARAAVRVDDDRVVAVAAVDAVHGGAVVDVDDVVAGAGRDHVGARVGVDDVVADAAVDVVGARPAVDQVVTVAGGYGVGRGPAVDGVVAGPAVERVVAEAG